jgi:hypothetical protein
LRRRSASFHDRTISLRRLARRPRLRLTRVSASMPENATLITIQLLAKVSKHFHIAVSSTADTGWLLSAQKSASTDALVEVLRRTGGRRPTFPLPRTRWQGAGRTNFRDGRGRSAVRCKGGPFRLQT